jgi:hypothetical protein
MQHTSHPNMTKVLRLAALRTAWTGFPAGSIMAGLSVLVLLLHAYFLWALGAAFGYDSIIYDQLGNALLTSGGLHTFYEGPRYFIFQHLGPGLPLLWILTCHVAEPYGWLLFAIIQHGIAAISFLYLLNVLRPLLPSHVLVFAAVLVTCNPVYQSLHNQPMTESISGSMYLLGLAAALDILLYRSEALFPFVVLAGSGIIASQFRSQGVIFFMIFATVVMLAGKNRAHCLWGFICLVCVFGSVLIWPVYRYAVTGHAFLPNAEYLLLEHALRYNPNPSRDVIQHLRTIPLPAGWSAESLARQGVSTKGSAVIGMNLRAQGMTDSEAKSTIRQMAWIVRTDSPDIMLNQLRLPLLSIGISRLLFLGDAGKVIHRGYRVQDYARHVIYWGKWEGGVLWDDYSQEFDRFLKVFRDDTGLYDSSRIKELDQNLRPYFVDHPVSMRDPLHLVHVPSEVWVIGWLGALLMLWGQNRWGVLLLVCSVIANYLLNVAVPIGNPRYGYQLLPMYITGFAVGCYAVESFGKSVIANGRRLSIKNW